VNDNDVEEEADDCCCGCRNPNGSEQRRLPSGNVELEIMVSAVEGYEGEVRKVDQIEERSNPRSASSRQIVCAGVSLLPLSTFFGPPLSSSWLFNPPTLLLVVVVALPKRQSVAAAAISPIIYPGFTSASSPL